MAEVIKYKDSTVRIWGRFWDADTNDPIDPSPLSIKIEAPDGTTSTITHPNASIVAVETGVFYYRLPLTQLGKYRWRWLASGGGPDATAIIGTVISVTRGEL